MLQHVKSQLVAFEGISFNASLFFSSDEGQAKIFEELELTKLKEALESLRQAQAYLGLIDNLDWVISMTSDPANNFDAATKFVEFLVVDNLWNRGRTILAVKGRIETAGGYPELAVLHWRPSSSLFPDQQPDHYVEITEDFIHYPWQRIDDSDYRVLANPLVPSLS